MAKFKDYYEVIGIAPRSHVRVIEETYWQTAHQLKQQPTRAAAKKLRALNEAYEVLGTPHRRLAYDREFVHQAREQKRDRHPGVMQQIVGLLAKPFRLE
ncbi:MAG TPA: DnaJ domain-containing protein [Dehalococcoidia bacterium]|nr:DnaJ domain-containing protein [Dehalococcoidia bacterium]